MRCERITEPGSISNRFAGIGGKRCTRTATYTDGVHFFCTQHSKEPPTILKKASGKIRANLTRIEDSFLTDRKICPTPTSTSTNRETDR